MLLRQLSSSLFSKSGPCARALSSLSASTNAKPVLLVIGAGAGIGGTVARRFAREGYHACLCRRGDEDGLTKSVRDIEAEGGSASGFLFDAAKEGALSNVVDQIEGEIGPIEVALYNLGAQIGNRDLQSTTEKQFELGWKLGTFGLFKLAKSLLPRMEQRGSGTLLVTSSTAAVRGNPGQHSHAAAMGGRRMLCQSLNAEYASKGVHIAHVLIDGAVDAPDTLGKMLGPERFAKLKQSREAGLIDPSAVADLYWHIAHQPASTWVFECDIRSKHDLPWWNS